MTLFNRPKNEPLFAAAPPDPLPLNGEAPFVDIFTWCERGLGGTATVTLVVGLACISAQGVVPHFEGLRPDPQMAIL